MRFGASLFWIFGAFSHHYGFHLYTAAESETCPGTCSLPLVADQIGAENWQSDYTSQFATGVAAPSFERPLTVEKNRQVDWNSRDVSCTEYQCGLAVPVVQSDEWKTCSSLSSMWRAM